MTDTPDPIDVFVASRIKARRKLMRISQQNLAELIGVSFQQYGKYENASNRVSASRLVKIAVALHVSPAYFFDGLDLPIGASGDSIAAQLILSYIAVPEILDLSELPKETQKAIGGVIAQITSQRQAA